MKRKHRLHAAELCRLPRPPLPPLAPEAFMLCPPALLYGINAAQWLGLQWLYGRALAEARAVAAPSLLERDLLAVWN
jgi:hypothetical protein